MLQCIRKLASWGCKIRDGTAPAFSLLNFESYTWTSVHLVRVWREWDLVFSMGEFEVSWQT